MRTGIAGLLLIAVAVPATAQAENWPTLGFYSVESQGEGAARLCRFRAEVRVADRAFAFVVTERGGVWAGQVMAQDIRIAQAIRVIVGVDRQGVFEFPADHTDASPELSSVTGRIGDGADALADLRQAAQGAHRLQVEAAPYTQSVPAEGMTEALDDLTACRTAQPL